MLFIQYPPCSTCQKAKKWLDENGIPYTDRHIKENNPTYEELKQWYTVSGLPLRSWQAAFLLDSWTYRAGRWY